MISTLKWHGEQPHDTAALLRQLQANAALVARSPLAPFRGNTAAATHSCRHCKHPLTSGHKIGACKIIHLGDRRNILDVQGTSLRSTRVSNVITGVHR